MKQVRPKARAKKRSASAKRAPDRRLRQLSDQLRAVRAIGAAMSTAVGLDSLFAQIVPQISKLMRAERTTLFLYDAPSEQIWSKVAQGDNLQEIRLKLGEGIAGWVAKVREALNVRDAYDDPRFNPDVDARTGFRTRSVAAAPLVDRNGGLLGVLQVLNHEGGPFDAEDVGLLRSIAVETAIAVENAQLAQRLLDQNHELAAARERAERRRAELDLLYQLEQESAASQDLDELLSSILARVCERLRSDAGSVLLAERDTGRLYFRAATGARKDELLRVTLEPGEGVVSWVAEHGEVALVNRPDQDPRHNRALAEKIAYPATALLAAPLIWDRKILGAIEVLNPQGHGDTRVGYDAEDAKVFTLIAGQVARAIALTLERKARLDTERLAAIGRMLAGVAHDLRNPMTVISGFAQLMAIETDAASRTQRCERIIAHVDEMTGMIGDLLAFARGDSQLRVAQVDLTALRGDVDETLRLACDERQISLDVSAEPGSVYVDLGRTKRVLYNLAKNAVEALRAGERLSIHLSGREGGLVMRVKDTGPGLPEEVRSRLFEPFVTVGKSGGTGLGLAIVKRFVEDHAGRIEVASRAGAGTEFTVHLPAHPAPSAQQVIS